MTVVPGLLCPFCGKHPSQIRPPFVGAGTGHFYAACPQPSCQRLALFDYDAGVVKGTKSSMTFKFEARLVGSKDPHLKRIGDLVREAIDAAYLEKWSAAATMFRIVGEAITTKKILGRKYAPIRGRHASLQLPLGPLLSHLQTVKAAVCRKLGITRAALKRIVSSLHYLRKIGNTAAHFKVKATERILPNDLSVDLARQKVESILGELYGW